MNLYVNKQIYSLDFCKYLKMWLFDQQNSQSIRNKLNILIILLKCCLIQ